jgi:NAD(P)-dependent dehydrogenase (short-subunit alcohol dehydrogenase family)
MKHAIITGASRGIGYDTALQLVRKGYQVLALSRNEAALQQLQKQAGSQLDYLAYDISQSDCRQLLEKVESYGKVEVLVNNAGYLLKQNFHEITAADWQKVFEVNFFGPARLIQQLRPYLEAAEQAHVVNIGSMGGYQGSSKFPGLLGYSTSKAAIANLTECLAEEWKDKNISCNCLALGAVQTEMLAEAFPGFEPPMTSAQMGAYVASFADEGHQFYNGKVLPVSSSTP